MYNIYIIAPNVLEPYLGPSVVVHNTLKGFLALKDELEKKDVSLTFISISSNNRGVAVLNERIKVINTKLYTPTTFTGELQSFLRMYKLNTPDLVHSHDIYCIFPWLNKTKTVFTLHGIFWKERMYKGLYMKLSLWLNELRLKSYYRQLTKFVAISPYVLMELSQKGLDLTKTVVIENPVSDEFFDVKKIDDNIIFYPAIITQRKNQLGFLKAISLVKTELKDYKIFFTSSGDLKYFQAIKHFIDKNDLKNVRFLGKIPYEKLLELYSNASVVALTSFQETTPMVIAEAMATGTPVIASRVGGVPYMVKNGKTGCIVNPNDPKEIAESLSTLINDIRLRSRIGKRAKKEALKRWRAEVIVEKLICLYTQLQIR